MCQNLCVKGTFSRNFRCSVKDAVILLPGSNFFYFNWLQLIQKASAKVTFSWNFRCSTKKAVLLLRAWSTLDIAVSKCKVPSFYFSYFHLPFFNRKCICKSRLFLKLEVLHEGSSFIASIVEYPVCSNFKMYSVLILVSFF